MPLSSLALQKIERQAKTGRVHEVFNILTEKSKSKALPKSLPDILNLPKIPKKVSDLPDELQKIIIKKYKGKIREWKPQGIKIRYGLPNRISELPEDIQKLILNKYKELYLREWKAEVLPKSLTVLPKILPKSLSVFNIFPYETQKTILNNFKDLLRYKLRDWVRENKLNYDLLSGNHNAVDFLSLPENKGKIYYELLSGNTNPKIIPLLKERILKERLMTYEELREANNKINWSAVSKNINLIEILEDEENEDKLDLKEISGNTKAYNLLLRLLQKGKIIDFEELSRNPNKNAIQLLTMPKYIGNRKARQLSENTNSLALNIFIRDPTLFNEIDWEVLSENTNNTAIKLLEKKWKEEKELLTSTLTVMRYVQLYNDGRVIVWRNVCGNHNAIGLLRKKIAEEKQLTLETILENIEKEEKKRNWMGVDTEVIMRETDWRIDWSILSGNHNAILLLRKKIKEEKQLSKSDLHWLKEFEKVNWEVLSGNPNAIELLTENYDDIDWYALCSNINPDAIDLLIKKIAEENKLSKDVLDSLKLNEKVNWKVLSGSLNPRVIELLEQNEDKIDWGAFSSNTSPRAMELLRKRVWEEKRIVIAYISNEINWEAFSSKTSPRAMELLWKRVWEKEEDILSKISNKIDWDKLSLNPSIFIIA